MLVSSEPACRGVDLTGQRAASTTDPFEPGAEPGVRAFLITLFKIRKNGPTPPMFFAEGTSFGRVRTLQAKPGAMLKYVDESVQLANKVVTALVELGEQQRRAQQ